MTLRSLWDLPAECWWSLIAAMPTRLGVFLRRAAYRPRMASGRRFDIGAGVAIHGMRNLSLGDGTAIEDDCTLCCHNAPLTLGRSCYLNRNVRLGSAGTASLTLGDNVMVGPNVVMDTSRHRDGRTDIPMKDQGMEYRPISIGDDVWIGANAVVICGVSIGRGCIVGAGAVVTRDLPPYSVAVGVPARVVRRRDAARP
jgi:maltose O-acetyltransferase